MQASRDPVFVGTAGWSLGREQKPLFPEPGSHLERYSRRLRAVEINSSFYRHHGAKTYARWGSSVPSHFRFSVKLSKEFTHLAKLDPPAEALRKCLGDIRELGERFGVLLVQLPSSLAFENNRTEEFLGLLREHCPVPVAWEPRHLSWNSSDALSLLERYKVSKVRADPERCPSGALATDARLRYFRLHGSPEIYKSRYAPEFVAGLAAEIANSPSRETWCIFDNTTFGFALENALELNDVLDGRAWRRIVS